MMYYWRIFLWENGGKSTEYTSYVDAPIFLEDKLDETLDSGEIILKNMPRASRDAFPPKTKFRLERFITEQYADTPKTWDMVVDHDDVEEYEGCPEVCTHRIHLIEPSVIAQGMHVDNIALTYELQDVTLAYKTVADSDRKAAVSIHGSGNSVSPVYLDEDIGKAFHADPNNSTSTYRTTFKYYWDNLDGIENIQKFINPATSMSIKVSIPKLRVQTGDTYYVSGSRVDRWIDVCELPTKTTVTKTRKKRYVEMDNGAPKLDNSGNWIPNGKIVTINSSVIATAFSGPTAFDSATCNRKGRTQLSEEDADEVTYTEILTGPPYFKTSGLWDGLLTRVDEKSITDYFLNQESHWVGRVLSRKVSDAAIDISFTTDQIAESEQKGDDDDGYYIQYDEYTIKTVADYPVNTNLPIIIAYDGYIRHNEGDKSLIYPYILNIKQSSAFRMISSRELSVEATVNVQDTSTIQNSKRFLTKPSAYNCYKMLRKALLTCETRLLKNGLDSIKFPIYISQSLKDKLEFTQVRETVFEQKNLWEVLVQIGYYIHAIPYLEFANDNTDRFELKYRELGSKIIQPDTSIKKTIFNSQNISEYFSQFDSYTTNLFSPQNLVEEWLVVQTDDTTMLTSNDNAILRTKYNISEIIDFKVRKNTSGSGFVSILNRIFEQSVYSVLTCATDVFPSRAATVYYALGDNKIDGFSYVPPGVNGDNYNALSRILSSVFGVARKDIKFSDYTFYIQYRTQDSARINQFRPDLADFIKNSSIEQYPHHEQFYGQQEKIVDSERLSANLFGQLVRVGNREYQMQEYVADGEERCAGDLIEIAGDPYYAVSVESEYYPDAILQKVLYSKNFNQLSKIVTIPSEPRFYEVSERSTVRREVRLVDFMQLSTKKETDKKYSFLNDGGVALLKNIIFGVGDLKFPNYAYSLFKSDELREHLDSHGEDIPDAELFPSTTIVRDPKNSNIVHPTDSSDRRACVVPLLHFPMRDSIVFEWDMDDNYKAGDCIAVTDNLGVNTNDGAYKTLQGVRYCDIMGRADLFGFSLFYIDNVSLDEARMFPRADEYDINSKTCYATTPNDKYVGLDKDSREALSFNYQVALLHNDPSFVTFANLFGEKTSRLKVCLLKETVSMFDETVDFNNALYFAGNAKISDDNNPISIDFNIPSDLGLEDVKAIVLYEEDNGNMYPYIARNVDKLETELKTQPWFLYPAF